MTAITIIGIAAAATLLFSASTYILGRYMARVFIFPETKTPEAAHAMCLESEHYTEAWFNSLPLKEFSVESDFGYTIRGVYLDGGNSSDRLVIMCHGHTFTWHGMVKFFPLFLERGYSIVAYDHRFHGRSGGSSCTAGYYEKLDLQKVTDWALSHFPDTAFYGFFGESMGAATVLQYMPLDDRADFIAADCPYSDMLDLYRYKMELKHLPKLFQQAALYWCRRYIRRHAAFDPADVSPRTDTAAADTPLWLVHGDADRYVPAWMSRQVYDARLTARSRKDQSSHPYPHPLPNAVTALTVIPGAAHAQALVTDPEQYRTSLYNFLDALEKAGTSASEVHDISEAATGLSDGN